MSVPTAAVQPIRQLTRLRAEFSIAFARLTGKLFGGRLPHGIDYGAVARVCLPDWTRDGAIATPTTTACGISAYRLSESLGLSAETVRRHTHLLARRGILTATRGGVALSTSDVGSQIALRYYRAAHDGFLRLIEDVGATCDLDLPTDMPLTAGRSDILKHAIDTLLLPIDTFRPTEISPTAHLLWASFALVAGRRVTHDPDLARRYGDDLPPDALCDGISLRRVAAGVGVAYTSAWRHMADLVDRDLVTRLDGDRWTVLRNNRRGEMWDIGAAPTRLMLGKLRELARMGVTPDRVASLYIDGRPPQIDFATA